MVVKWDFGKADRMASMLASLWVEKKAFEMVVRLVAKRAVYLGEWMVASLDSSSVGNLDGNLVDAKVEMLVAQKVVSRVVVMAEQWAGKLVLMKVAHWGALSVAWMVEMLVEWMVV